jgi:glyoxylase-like metal-dependent hydrolase (beta-lactamase superfamily II)
MKIGNYDVFKIKTGLFKLDGGAMFGVVPKSLWNKTNPADDRNRIEMCTNSLFINNGNRKILIDTGIGNKLNYKLRDIYAVDNSMYSLENSLKEINIKPEEITDVILTHLHFDHCGGCTYYDDENQLNLTFPNAVHYVQRKHYDWAKDPTERDKASFIQDDFEPLIKNNNLKMLEGNYKFDDFISLEVVNGHTPFMQIVKICDDKSNIINTADLIPMASHIPVPYIMGYDLLPLITLQEKKIYLQNAVDNNQFFFFEHDRYTDCASVEEKNGAYFLKDKIKF